jgi:hypothetical protein
LFTTLKASAIELEIAIHKMLPANAFSITCNSAGNAWSRGYGLFEEDTEQQ